jgi:Protein of unknown function (DUF2934)
MQLKKPSKKTSQVATEATAPVSEEAVVSTSKPRASKSSKKKSESSEMASVSHHHKAASPLSSEPFASKPLNETPRRVVHHYQIAELAYGYWVERGFAHGSHEEDWLRAEKALGIS